MSNPPFKHRALVERLITKIQNDGHEVSISIKINNGSNIHFGNAAVGLEVCKQVADGEKRESGEWIKNPNDLKKLKIPLSLMKQKDVVTEAPNVLRHFIGPKAKYGEGNCFFWTQKVNVNDLKICLKEFLRKSSFNGDMISLNDIIEWSNFKIVSFGAKPPSSTFKHKISWTQFLKLLIKIVYTILNLDPESIALSKKNS